jgi:hypothetical protein
LARQAAVSKSTSSLFFKDEFGGWEKYRGLCHRLPTQLGTKLKRLNGDFSLDELSRPLPAEFEEIDDENDD